MGLFGGYIVGCSTIPNNETYIEELEEMVQKLEIRIEQGKITRDQLRRSVDEIDVDRLQELCEYSEQNIQNLQERILECQQGVLAK